ncbi:DUF5071 domain-containing protein [Clostridium bornimense]|uniref:DUF5071 domain-containing protein n=1 Tax=Clostridium bornimense TaxID=1216932 RepID=UPI001C11FEEA|nr:DUF5071 domain-containing protein [Clostridium bornimense]MBU5317417.1 DUF5071 domain-containing protein [Clostridium bornimense]
MESRYRNTKDRLVERNDYKLELLIQPGYNKDVWENAAIVLVKKGYKEYKKVIDKMFWCLQDMNWPGSSIIYEELVSINKINLINDYENIVSICLNKNDEEWLYNLYQFSKDCNINRNDFKKLNLYDKMVGVVR